MATLPELLHQLVELNGSDLHLTTSTPPQVRVHGKLQRLEDKYRSDSGASFALTVGSTFNTGWTVIPFVEARYTIGVVDELTLAAGILFSTGLGAE